MRVRILALLTLALTHMACIVVLLHELLRAGSAPHPAQTHPHTDVDIRERACIEAGGLFCRYRFFF